MMEVIPAIDILGGRCVRLYQGDYGRETVFDDDPVAVAVRWSEQGAPRIHVVDLDGAREGRPVQQALIRAIVETVDTAVQVGGGAGSLETLRELLAIGVGRVVLGTAAVANPPLLREAVAIAGDALVVSVDARDGFVRTDGWTEGTNLEALPFLERLDTLGVRRVVYTDIARDGTDLGPDIATCRRLAGETSLEIIAAGGVSSLGDIRALADCGVAGVIVGRALYTGEVALPEALAVARRVAAPRRP